MTNHSQILKAAHAQARRTMALGTVYHERLAIAMRDMYAFARNPVALGGYAARSCMTLSPSQRHNLAV